MKILKMLGLATAIAFIGVSAHAETELKLAHAAPDTDLQQTLSVFFKEQVEARTNGSVKVTIFPQGQLGNDQAMIDGARSGIIDIVMTGLNNLTGLVPNAGAFELPFMFPNRELAYKVLDGEVGQGVSAQFTQHGLKMLGYPENGYRNMTNNRRPIAKLEDIQGLKLRVIAAPVYIDLFTQLGANPVPMTFGEVYGALESGAIDGQDNPLAVIQSAKFAEVQDYLSITRHIYTGMPFLMSGKTWDSLSADEQKIIAEAADEAKRIGRDLVQEQEVAAIESLGQEMEVNELAVEEVARMREAAKPVIDKFAEEAGASVMERANAQLAEMR